MLNLDVAGERDMAKAKSRRRFRIPIVLILIGALGLLAALFVQFQTLPVDRPLGLQSNTVKSDTFTADYTSRYVISVSMSEKAAARLYGCNVDPDKFSDDCNTKLPLDLSFKLLEGGRDISSQIIMDPPSDGGEFAEDEYIKDFALVDLERGKTYTLVVGSKVDGTILQPANPHLLVAVAPMTLEGEMIERFLIEAFCCVLMLVGVIWAIVGLLLGRKDAVSAK